MGVRIAIIVEPGGNGRPWVGVLREARYEVKLFPASAKVDHDVRAWEPEMIAYCCGAPQGPSGAFFLRLRRGLNVPILVIGLSQEVAYLHVDLQGLLE